jgi:sigma-B regulation protein RsbU (phosphoserine phosphatase)
MINMNPPASEKMQCMEVWGGNKATWSQFSVPGLDLWVHSEPFRNSDGGGDVYYLSSCASGRITRMLLADVSGHGASVAPIAVALRDLMRQNINFISQTHFVASLNSQFENVSATGCFATALVSTYFSPTRTLSVCNAGHPLPLFRDARTGQWSSSDAGTDKKSLNNMPIGIVDDGAYRSTSLRLNVHDMVLTYTDSLSEALDANGRMLGTQGVCNIVNGLRSLPPELLIPRLLEIIRELNSGNLIADDTTVMLLRANGSGVSFVENLKAPFRILKGLWQAQFPSGQTLTQSDPLAPLSARFTDKSASSA